MMLVAVLGTGMGWGQSTGAFTAAGNMIMARMGHTATLLRDGRVLIAGGEGYVNGILAGLASAELYDPATGIFTATGSMTTPHGNWHTATLLPDGKVLIAGGFGLVEGSKRASAELYDPSTGTFVATADMTVDRYLHSATLLNNGQVLIVGGVSTSSPFYGLASAELYDPSAGTFNATGNMTASRVGSTATLLADGRVLIANPTYDGLLASSELYDPSTGTFTHKGSTAKLPYYWHTASLLMNGTLLISGGGDADDGTYLANAELYNPSTGMFTATGNMTTGRYLHTANLLPDGTVLIAGSQSIGGNGRSSAELYDPVTGTFRATGSMATGRSLHTSTLLNTGKVLITGGIEYFPFGSNGRVPPLGILSSAELYNPTLLVLPLVVTDLRFDRTSTAAGASYSVNVSGSNLTPQTFFDVRFAPPGSNAYEVVSNWQRGAVARHDVPAGTVPGTWTINGVRAHEVEADHTGSFIPVSATITVFP